MKNIVLFIPIVLFWFTSCEQRSNRIEKEPDYGDTDKVLIGDSSKLVFEKTNLAGLEESMIALGLVNIRDLDSTIRVDLKYSTTDNFLATDVYGDLVNCYLQKDVAEKVALAQLLLKSKYPYFSLIIYDGARPLNVQQVMWNILKLPVREKTKYLSNPNSGSLHNYGAAVDISIVDDKGVELDMGTKFDYFGELAYPEKEEKLNIEGKLSFVQISNRKLLRSVMQQAGFFNIETEWWHFNSCTRNAAAQKYQIIP